MKKILIAAILLKGLLAPACATTPLIDNPSQIKDGILERKMAPAMTAIGVATASLRTDLTIETTTRIAVDLTKASLTGNQTFSGLNIFTDTVTVSESLRYLDGNEAAGKILKSDASGYATWQTPTSGAVLSDTQTFTGQNTFANYVRIEKAINQQFTVSDNSDVGGRVNLFGATGLGGGIMFNTVFNGAGVSRSGTNGGTTMVATEDGSFSIMRSTPGIAGEALTGNQVFDWLAYDYAVTGDSVTINSLYTITHELIVTNGIQVGIQGISGVSRARYSNTDPAGTSVTASCPTDTFGTGGWCDGDTTPLHPTMNDYTDHSDFVCSSPVVGSITATIVCMSVR